jgi:hypothetical protein
MRFARFFAVAFACLTASADAGQLAEIVERTGLSGGLVVCVGGDPGLCEDAAALGDTFLVQLLDTDPAAVAKTRQALHASSVHGRITASGFDGVRLPYVDNLINLIVVADPDCRISADEIQRVLAPLGTAVGRG